MLTSQKGLLPFVDRNLKEDHQGGYMCSEAFFDNKHGEIAAFLLNSVKFSLVGLESCEIKF